MTSVQIIWLCSVAVILLALAGIATQVFHLHPMRFLRRHHFIGIERYDFLYDDDDCDE
ncbi:MAG: hypothetical protein K2L55_09260 [Muribaculaceae bacterium]|nr:hypothetical protein [Muribaculaceae bacterium]